MRNNNKNQHNEPTFTAEQVEEYRAIGEAEGWTVLTADELRAEFEAGGWRGVDLRMAHYFGLGKSIGVCGGKWSATTEARRAAWVLASQWCWHNRTTTVERISRDRRDQRRARHTDRLAA